MSPTKYQEIYNSQITENNYIPEEVSKYNNEKSKVYLFYEH